MNVARIEHWLSQGARMSDRVKFLLTSFRKQAARHRRLEGGSMGDDASALIQLGFVGAPFGVRGWIKLRSHTDPPERLLEHRSLRIGQGSVWQSYRIEASGRSAAR